VPYSYPNPRREISKALHDGAAVAQLAHKLANELLHIVLSLLLAAAAVVLLLATMVLLLATAVVRLLLPGVATTTTTAMVRGRDSLPASEIDVDAAGVLFGMVLKAELAADLLDAGLDLLNVVHAVVALSDDAVSMCGYALVLVFEPGRKSSAETQKCQRHTGITHTWRWLCPCRVA